MNAPGLLVQEGKTQGGFENGPGLRVVAGQGLSGIDVAEEVGTEKAVDAKDRAPSSQSTFFGNIIDGQLGCGKVDKLGISYVFENDYSMPSRFNLLAWRPMWRIHQVFKHGHWACFCGLNCFDPLAGLAHGVHGADR